MSRESLYLASQAQRQRVATVLEGCVGPERAKHIPELARLAGVKERYLRDAYAQQLDGESFVLGKVADGLYLCETEEQAAALDAELLSKLRSIAKRLRARRSWWKRQGEIKQLDLFGAIREDRWSA